MMKGGVAVAPLTQENRQALFNLYLYLAPKGTPPANGATLGEIIGRCT